MGLGGSKLSQRIVALATEKGAQAELIVFIDPTAVFSEAWN